MKTTKRTQLTPNMMNEWASIAHAVYLDSLMSQSNLTCKQIAFHGGTSLHLSWRSPRFSEDLDFLLSNEVDDLDAISKKIESCVSERFLSIDPQFVVEIKDKTKNKDRMPVYNIVVSHPAYIGNAMVKAEFWRVDRRYLEGYPTEFRTPILSGDFVSHVSNPVPAAALTTAYCDKLTAFATRPHLKWRDIYDLWWIGTQTDTPLDMSEVIKQFKHNVTAYTTLQELPPAQALSVFLKNSKDDIVRKADPDIKRWLPDNLWKRLNPEGIVQMVDYVFYALESISNAMNNNEDDSSRSSLKRVRP